MLGLLALGLTSVMIYTLVKNALIGKQLTSHDTYLGTVELLVPVTQDSHFFMKEWQDSLANFHSQPAQLKIHFLIEGHRPEAHDWSSLHDRIPFVEVHHFLTKPESVESATWMIDQVKLKVKGQVVVIGDPEIVPTEDAFISLSKIVTDKNKPYFALPQTARLNVLGEAIAVLNPNLAFASVFGFRRIRKNISHPLMGLTHGWMGMDFKTFEALNFGDYRIPSWKHALSYQWDRENLTYLLAFGEKNLIRYYNNDVKSQLLEMKANWKYLFDKVDRNGLWLFLVALFLWSFPVLCFFTHPYWSLASLGLLIFYRFFSKIVFQESWLALVLHLVGCLAWIGTLGWIGVEALKQKYGSKTSA